MLKYLKYSGVWVGFVLNPYHWTLEATMITPDDLNPNQFGYFVSGGPVWVRFIVDDGSW
jgi:hypothetical protein